MKRWKDEDKVEGPMFPRLHVNEIDKGGPRAPPRNKMALYEQLSVPSQRFTNAIQPRNLDSNTGVVGFMPSSSQGGGSEKGMAFSRHLPSEHHSEKHVSRYSELIAPVTRIDKRKESYDEDFRVPIFIHTLSRTENVKHTDDSTTENRSLSKSSFSNPSRNPKTRIQEEENLKEIASGQVEDVSNSSLIQETGVEQRQVHLPPDLLQTGDDADITGDDPANNRESLASSCNGKPELGSISQITGNVRHNSVMQWNVSTVDKRRASLTTRVASYGTKSCDGESCRLSQVINLERGDGTSETMFAGSVRELEVTPDDVVGVIGQKRFWKARRSIVNQQRVFADQVFELHRLIKVQRSIATSPQFLLADITYTSKPTKALPEKKPQPDYPTKALPTIAKQKLDSDKPNQKESSAENTVGMSSSTSVQNDKLPSHQKPFDTSHHNDGATFYNQPHGSHWLIPMMSPSEGLVYKPFPAPAFPGPSGSGWGPPVSNALPHNNFFPPAAYGIPAPYPPYQFPSFPAYGMPVMGTSSFSSSSIEQANQPSRQGHMRVTTSSANLHESEHVEVQGSTESSVSGRSESGVAMEGRNKFTIFPTSPVDVEPPTRVIKVVPHKAGSVTESVARIFRSIQEERKHHSS